MGLDEEYNPFTDDDYGALALPPDLDIAQLKIPPHSLEAEQSVIGGLLIGGAWDNVADLVLEDDFYRPEHRKIFGFMAFLADAARPIDITTVADVLNRAGQLEEIGGFIYLANLARNTPSASNIRAYATAVRERATLRKMIGIGQSIAAGGFDPEGRSSAALIDEAQASLMALGEIGADHVEVTLNQGLKSAVDRIDMLYNSDAALTGLSTGFPDLDRRTNGMQRGDLIIVGARPSMGKTAFGMNLVESAILNGETAMVFSMEMPHEQLIMRMLASVGRIPLTEVTTGKIQDENWPRLSAAISRLKDRNLFIDDRGGLTMPQIRTAARKRHRTHPIRLLLVDYLQLAQGTGRDGRTEDVSAISRGLKALAKELGCSLVALSQLNRGVEERPNKRPRNADLRESGAIEQDADIIIMLYRDEVYNEESQHKGICEAIVTKFRNGAIGTEYLASRLDIARFETLARGSQSDQ